MNWEHRGLAGERRLQELGLKLRKAAELAAELHRLLDGAEVPRGLLRDRVRWLCDQGGAVQS